MKRTVFVTGAGASAPYGFPLGMQLAGGIIGWLQQPQSLELLKPFGLEREQIISFAESLQQSGRQSVDAFLEHRPEYIQIGKLAIANSLIQCEQLPMLFGRSDSWLDYLFNRTNCPFEKFGQSGIAFITFNYDRSPEQYFYLLKKFVWEER